MLKKKRNFMNPNLTWIWIKCNPIRVCFLFFILIEAKSSMTLLFCDDILWTRVMPYLKCNCYIFLRASGTYRKRQISLIADAWAKSSSSLATDVLCLVIGSSVKALCSCGKQRSWIIHNLVRRYNEMGFNWLKRPKSWIDLRIGPTQA